MSDLVVHGWRLFAHPLLMAQMERLVASVERHRLKEPHTWQTTADAKLLAAMQRLLLEEIPADPGRAEYRQGGTLGESRKHWFRAKFGAGRFRLFFRYSSRSKAIVYAWVNDATTLRTYGSNKDAYAVFRRMLDAGSPPENWDELTREAGSQDGWLEHLAASHTPSATGLGSRDAASANRLVESGPAAPTARPPRTGRHR